MDDPKTYDDSTGHRSTLDELLLRTKHYGPVRLGIPPELQSTLRKDRRSREDRQLAEGMILPKDAGARKNIPITSGCLDYFPLALAYVARISKAGNDQHNPGQPLHWARGKSVDHADCIPRHLVDRGTNDTDGLSHTGKLAWRSLALLQEELEGRIANGEDPFITPEK